MFIELVDSLRCPAPHESSLLIASATRIVARHILDGELGCPICHARYPIDDGVTWFDRRVRPGPNLTGDPEEAIRIAALLDLREPGGFAMLADAAGAAASDLRAVAADVHLVLINPPADVAPAPGLTLIMTGVPLPFADGAARGAAAGEPASDAMLGELARVVRPGGRVVAPATASVPATLSQIAADDRQWVAERGSTARLITLKRGGGE